MARYPQGLAHWPGVAESTSCDYTLSHGVTPGVAMLTVPLGGGTPAEHGTLAFSMNGSVVVSFKDCKLADMKLQAGDGGQMLLLTILDRRWKWSWGAISGHYNTRLPDGDVDPDRELSPQVMAALCLDAMGESGYNVSALPDDARPQVDWEFENPARALADLAEQFGCRVVLKTDGRVMLARSGAGASLPLGYTTESAVMSNPPEKPSEIWFVCGPSRYQFEWGLQAVGQDGILVAGEVVPGEIKPIDNLSYKPANGWSYFDLEKMVQVAAAYRHLAQRTVFRMYRIVGNADFGQPLNLPGFGKLADGFQVLPIEDVQVRTYEDEGIAPPANLGAKGDNGTSLPAEVRGIFYPLTQAFKNSAADTKVQIPFSIIRDQAIVAFEKAIFGFSTNGKIETVTAELAAQPAANNRAAPARLKLIAACSVRNAATWQWVRHIVKRKIGNVKTPPRIIREDKVYLNYFNGQPTNKVKVEKEAKAVLDAIEKEYQTVAAAERSYEGILNISPDGAIQQVAWHVGEPFASTQAGRNTEFSLNLPSYEERRRTERISNAHMEALREQRQQQEAAKANPNPFAVARG